MEGIDARDDKGKDILQILGYNINIFGMVNWQQNRGWRLLDIFKTGKNVIGGILEESITKWTA